ncbi:hypothetical protein [Alteraurantiacibacter aquimixticola]|uniref:hypothetical protein n=1 Tax=Alteraurantiacibacter aquimixticola TaxID=2489173 RepID=UPI00145C1987|nr:hypothetical protein [Alteraurantiacibacter aquimixticola]
MDMNQLLYNHELAKLNAKRAILLDDRKTYFDLVNHYAKRIAEYRTARGLPRTGWPEE